ncbi:MAG: Hsp70 family protein, partial [Fimbriimonadaceae bacterium]
LQVSAQDKATNQRQSITISGSGNLSRDEIEKKVKEAEANAEADLKAQELAELKNKSDQLCYSTEKLLRESTDMSESERGTIESQVADLRKAVAAENQEDMQTAFSVLEASMHKLSEEAYKKASAQSEGAEQAHEPASTPNEDVVDAEFKEEE